MTDGDGQPTQQLEALLSAASDQRRPAPADAVALWSERHGFGFLSPLLAALEMPFILAPLAPPADTQIADLLIATRPSAIEAFDPEQQPLHERLRARLGRLEHDDIYAATPAPPRLGGTPIEDYEVADALEWLEAVYTQMNVTLVDYQRVPFQLRMIGDPWPSGLVAGQKRLPL